MSHTPVTVHIDGYPVAIPESIGSLRDVIAHVQTVTSSDPRRVASLVYVDADGDAIDIANQEDYSIWLDTKEGQLQMKFAEVSSEGGVGAAGVPLAEDLKDAGDMDHDDIVEVDPFESADHIDGSDSSDDPAMVAHRSSRKTNSLDVEEVLSIDPKTLKYLDALGVGASGTVYKCVDLLTDRLLAIKSISLDVTQDEQEQILAELEILHKCDHRYIIDFYGAFFTPDSRIQICTEFMDGGSFEGKPPISDQIVLAGVAYAIFHGLTYLWSKKILHRDVKPSNILVNSLGEVKLCDFGVSVQLATSIAKTYIGTNAYMAPERLKGDVYGVPADVWSAGMSILELATGQLPLSSDVAHSPFLFMQKMLTFELDNDQKKQLADPALITLVTGCLKAEPTERITLAAALSNDFVLVAGDEVATRQKVAEWLAQVAK